MQYRIGVIGQDGEISGRIREISERIGRDIARNNSILICGGKGGVMESACRGAKSSGGITVGILPSLDKKDANPCVDIPPTTGLGYARNSLVVSCSDVIIAIGGRVGTLSEIGLALSYGKPVVIVKDTGGISEFIKEKLRDIEMKGKIYESGFRDAVRIAINLIL